MCECLRGALAPSEAPDVPDEPLGRQFPSLSYSLQAFVCMYVRVCACGSELEIHVHEAKMKGASK